MLFKCNTLMDAKEFHDRLLDFGYESKIKRDFRGNWAVKPSKEGEEFISALWETVHGIPIAAAV